MLKKVTILLCIALVSVFSSLALAQEKYYTIPFAELDIEADRTSERRMSWRWESLYRSHMFPYAIAGQQSECFVLMPSDTRRARNRFRRNMSRTKLVIRSESDKKIDGTLYIPTQDLSKMQQVDFAIAPEQADNKTARSDFYKGKAQHYTNLLEIDNLSGKAWFRHQRLTARLAGEGKILADMTPADLNTVSPSQGEGVNALSESYNLFSGGRAVSENLQLNAQLRIGSEGGAKTIPIGDIEGITTAEIDWEALTKGKNPEKDTLAANVPHDQHALFFPSFESMLHTLDTAAEEGSFWLQVVETVVQHSKSRQRYENQLCTPLTDLARKLGPSLIQSIAFTGSDPYVRTGTDMAVLFEAKQPTALIALIKTIQQQAAQKHPNARMIKTTEDGVVIQGITTPTRKLSSFIAQVGTTVIVTNSEQQLQRIIQTHKGKLVNIAASDEYVFFRSRYPVDAKGETAFLVLTDATIRRWCSPAWRIAASRRTRATAILAELQACRLDPAIDGKAALNTFEKIFPGLGDLSYTTEGPMSSVFGTLAFQTPILELDIQKVTEVEDRRYSQFRTRYQRQWRNVFDPIAFSFSLGDSQIEAELSVRPLIASSDYREFMNIAGDTSLARDAGYPHKQALFHWVMAIDKDSMQVQQASNFTMQMAPGMPRVNLLSWMGNWITFFVDDAPLWRDQEFQKALTNGKEESLERFMEEHLWELPVAFAINVENSFKLTGFLTGLRAFVEQSAPGMISWQTRNHQEQAYVCISPSEQARASMGEYVNEDTAIYYAVTGKMLLLSLSEDIIKHAINRASDKDGQASEKDVSELQWLGKSLGARIQKAAVGPLQAFLHEQLYRLHTEASWANIAILNEWKRRFDVEDPVAFHEKHWQNTLRCPSNQLYKWNAAYQTVYSTAFGAPAKHAEKPTAIPSPLDNVNSADFGITFEADGLRAKIEIQREGTE